MRGTWLTWRIHRFEVVFVLAIGALVTLSAWVIGDQIRSLGLAEVTCWPRTENGDYATRECGRLMDAFWPLEGQSGLVRVGLNVVPAIVGIILGVPVVGRELELRTAGFSWALTASRTRWLLARLLPMALVAVVALGIMGLAGRDLFDAIWLGRYGPDLTEVSTEGLALVLRGLAAFGVGLLIGALVGRTMPALLIGAVVMAVWGLVVVPQAQAQLIGSRLEWRGPDEWRSGGGSWLGHLGEDDMFDVTNPGLPGEPGARVDQETAWRIQEAELLATCGETPDYGDEDGPGTPEFQAWGSCADGFWSGTSSRMQQWSRIVPRSAWPDFSFLDAGMSLLLGGAAIAATFPIVARRRPE
ncbi:MAG: hypothetical protein KF809_15270 [Chloroflexi bacterium]|nr:hypothetical protein [Chloroflexota bacterium]